MTTLKKQLKSNAEKNLRIYKKLLTVLKNSTGIKEQSIIDCEHAIRKQEQIIQIIEGWEN